MSPDQLEQRLENLEEQVDRISNLVCSLWFSLYEQAGKPIGDTSSGFLLWLGTRHERYNEFAGKEVSKIDDSNNPT